MNADAVFADHMPEEMYFRAEKHTFLETKLDMIDEYDVEEHLDFLRSVSCGDDVVDEHVTAI